MDDEGYLILNKIELEIPDLAAILETVLVPYNPHHPESYDHLHIAENMYEMRRNLILSRQQPYGVSIEFAYGWYPIVSDLWDQIMHLMLLDSFHVMDQKSRLNIHLMQLKEKFGGLRFYYNMTGDDEVVINIIRTLVHDCEQRSYYTCETCGTSGERRNDLGWIMTLCDLHYGEKQNSLKSK